MSDDNYDLSVDFCGMHFPYPWMNASGIWSFISVGERHKEHLGAFVTKSTSFLDRSGNETPTIARTGSRTMINAMGLNNPGREQLAAEAGVSTLGVPIIASIFGNSTEEIEKITGYLDKKREGKVTLLPTNSSCFLAIS